MKHAKTRPQLERVRRICLAFPEASERLSHGEPTWFVCKRVFAMFSSDHHHDGHISVLIPAAMGVQSVLIEADPLKFYRPPYVGVRGWPCQRIRENSVGRADYSTSDFIEDIKRACVNPFSSTATFSSCN